MVRRYTFGEVTVMYNIIGNKQRFLTSELGRLVPVQVVSAVRVPLTASAGSAAVLATLAAFWIHDLPTLIAGAALSVGAYVIFAGFVGGAAWRVEFLADGRTVLQG